MIYRELSEREYSDAESRILYEDNHLLVVNKRAGEIVQADKTEDETLADLYRAFIAKRNGKEGEGWKGWREEGSRSPFDTPVEPCIFVAASIARNASMSGATCPSSTIARIEAFIDGQACVP